MIARVVVHIRESGSRSAVLTPVPFVDLAVGPIEYERGLAQLRTNLAQRLSVLEPVDRLSFEATPEATLHRVPTEVGRGDGAIEISLGIVVIPRKARDQVVAVAYSPVVPNTQVVQRDGDVVRLLERAAAKFAKQMSKWSASAILAADEPDDSRVEIVSVDSPTGGTADGGTRQSILAELGLDLTSSDVGRIDQRDDLVRRVLETLAAEGRSSVMLVGRSDVGKTALVHEIGRRIAEGDAPEPLRGRRLWRISANELIAGAQYTGMWQQRAQRLVAEARDTHAIVAMGDPIGIIDAGRWSQSSNNLSRFLRPYVESGDLSLICECTPEQLASAHAKEPSFADAFQRVDIPEPSLAVTREIAARVVERLSQTASVAINDEAVDAAVELTRRFEPYRSFPGKAIRLIEDAVRERPKDATSLDRADVTETFARRSGMPVALLSDTHKIRHGDLLAHFESRVLGQPGATTAMTDIVMVVKAALNDPGKPLSSFFFVGPTGVGKTELAKALAEYLFGSRERLIRIDMGEYGSADAVQRLIGTAWGSNEGELTRRVREQPFCVLLLDEIEKAHWSVFDALLAVLDEGRLTDASGRSADFRNAIVIMTSNLGATRARTGALGFGAGTDVTQEDAYVEEAESFFRPEFFNRINRIVVFHALGTETVRLIARRELDQLLRREGIVRRGVQVEVDDAVIEAVSAAGFHPRYGARPLHRQIEQAIMKPLARLLVDRPPRTGDFIRITLSNGDISVTAERVFEPPDQERRRAHRRAEADASLTALEQAAVTFTTELETDDAAASAGDLRGTMSELIDNSHESTFWDDTERARETLSRLYGLEQIVGRYDRLRDRATGLCELARRVRETHNKARSKEIPAAIEEMRDQLLVLRLELAAAAAGADGEIAELEVVPVGSADAWAMRLVVMYEQWANRTGRDSQRAGETGLTITGAATLDLLRGECGLHRHVRPDRIEELARVLIRGVPALDMNGGRVVRVYEEGKRRLVRDPITRARVTHLSSVLDEGHIDAFLIAALRSPGTAETKTA